MAHLLTPPAPTTAPTALSARARKASLNSWKNGCFPTPRVCCVGRQYQHPASSISDHDQLPPPSHDHTLPRRALMGLSGALVLGLGLSDEQRASAAGRRPPPPPPEEKKDPNVSGVQAKVLASKKRKEAMKQEMVKLRERGKPIKNEPPPPPPPPPAEAASE